MYITMDGSMDKARYCPMDVLHYGPLDKVYYYTI